MKLFPARKKNALVHVALSGGVDSAVAAHLLKKDGYEVHGVFMKNWSGEDFGLENECPWREDQEMAESVCKHLDIPFKTYNFEKEYRKEIIDNFFEEYRKGNTPNPDILCNKQIKFGSFLERSLKEGADFIATGHYAQLRENRDRSFDLMRAKDQNKDQTYFLYRLDQNQLSRTIFPLGTIEKDDVRRIAAKANLPNADRKDSQGICFLGKIDVREFLGKGIESREGKIVDTDTKETVGKHAGVWFYTNGQREGLRIGGTTKPYYVAGKDVERNILYVAMGHKNPALHTRSIKIADVHWINNPPEKTNLTCMIRYRQKPEPCELNGNSITFRTPVWLPSPGQSAVLLDGDKVLGGGVIESIEPVSK